MKVEIHQDGEGWSSGGKGDAEVEVRLFDGIYPHTSAYIQLNIPSHLLPHRNANGLVVTSHIITISVRDVLLNFSAHRLRRSMM